MGETTSPRVCCVGGRCRLLASSSLWGLGVLVVAPLWWWGVVFDLWIVVASIEMMACVKGLPSFVGVGVFVWVVVSCNANFSDIRMQSCFWWGCVWVTHFLVSCCKCLRAH